MYLETMSIPAAGLSGCCFMKERGHGKIGLCRRLTGSAWNMVFSKERLSWTHVIASRHFRAGAFVERSQDIQSSSAARKGSS